MDAVLMICIMGFSLAQDLEPDGLLRFTDILTNTGSISVQLPNVDHYYAFLYDEVNDEIIVGAKDHLLQFDLSLHLKRMVEVPSPDDSVKRCTQSHPADECHNFIKILHLFNDAFVNKSNLYVCGTSSYDPVCSWWEKGNMLTPTAQFDGRDNCPSNPHASTAFFFNNNPTQRLMFLGTSFANDTHHGTIRVTRMALGRIHFSARRVQGPSKLYNAEFAGLFKSEPFLFFVFRENALEYSSNEKTSRIARVCSNADWWLYNKENLTDLLSFTKARIECGQHTSVQGISFVRIKEADPLNSLLFATFQSSSLKGSAVCVYHLGYIQTVFLGDFWCQNSSEPTIWEVCQARPIKIQTKIHQTCFGKRDSRDVEDRILMNEIIVPECGGPIYETNSTKLSQIDVKPVFAGGFRAVIVGDNGHILEFAVRNCSMHLNRIWHVIPTTERSNSINFLVQLFDEVYVLTNSFVMRISRKNVPSAMNQVGFLSSSYWAQGPMDEQQLFSQDLENTLVVTLTKRQQLR